MWEALGTSIKSFMEKDLIPFMISLAAGIVAVIFLPEDNWMIEKVGAVWIGILAFAACFLLVKLIVSIAKGIKSLTIKGANKKYRKKQDQKEEKETLAKLWGTVDAMTPGDRQTLQLFLDNGNSPLEESGSCFHSCESVLWSCWIASTKVPYEFEGQERQPSVNSNGIPNFYFINQGKTRYKLKDDIYQLLKYSKEKYGRISNFE